MAQQLSQKHLLGTSELTVEDIELILETAVQFKEVLQRPIKKVPSLRDVTIANLFFENSTRTRLSFELAQKRLSADTISFAASASSLTKGETLRDTVRNIVAMKVDMIVMRHQSSGAAHFVTQHTDAIVVNAGDGMHEHPTQALLDAYTIQEKLGGLAGKRVAIVGDILHSRVARSNAFLLTKMGAAVRFYGPTLLLPYHWQALGAEAHSPKVAEAFAWADVVMVLRVQLERQGEAFFTTDEYTRRYGVSRQMLDEAGRQVLIMHPGPINRGVEITTQLADSPHSVILDQVENGVAVRMAVMYLLAGRG